MHNELKTCRVCGLNYNDFHPWGVDGKTASYEICDCCGVTFGNEDSLSHSVIKFRKDWIKNGAKWFNRDVKPEDWSLEKSLHNIPEKYK